MVTRKDLAKYRQTQTRTNVGVQQLTIHQDWTQWLDLFFTIWITYKYKCHWILLTGKRIWFSDCDSARMCIVHNLQWTSVLNATVMENLLCCHITRPFLLPNKMGPWTLKRCEFTLHVKLELQDISQINSNGKRTCLKGMNNHDFYWALSNNKGLWT